MKLYFIDLPEELRGGLCEVAGMLGVKIDTDGIPVRVFQTKCGLEASLKDGLGRIGYSRKVEFFRALGLFAEEQAVSQNFEKRETPVYDSVGPFFDNSRNAVFHTDTIKKWVRFLALMGHDTLYLYTEDTYAVKDYPYFGYMRGRFTPEEIRDCDRYAQLFGVELVPCIQTLAHLNAALRWNDFGEITDCNDILLVGEDKTYELIEAMLKSLRAMYSTGNINIGMDEANMIGLGNYMQKHGFQPRFDIMVDHLRRVISLCEKYGFKPMMWSDMFFHLLFSNYYNTAAIDQKLLDKIPSNVSLVYWDYYSLNKDTYDKNLDNHLKFNNEVIFAGGAWKWSGMVPSNRFSLKASRLALDSCREHKIKKVMVTTWGDDGADCSSFAVLPVLQLYAEDCYTHNTVDGHIAKRLKTCTGADFNNFVDLDLPNLLPGNEEPKQCGVNPSKYLLFQDVLCGLYDRHVLLGAYNKFYSDTADRERLAAKGSPDFALLFETSACLCDVLALKCDIGLRLRGAYLAHDLKTLRILADVDLPELVIRINKLHQSLRRQWMAENKVFGFDVQDIRYGGLKERMRTAINTIHSYLNAEIEAIPELEIERLDSHCRRGDGLSPHVPENVWKKIVTANTL